MQLELLDPRDYGQFSDLFEKHFNKHPFPETTTAVVAKDGPEIVGFLGVHQVYTVDSMWIKPGYRHKGLWKSLIKAVINLSWKKGSTCYFFATKKKEDIVARLFGAFKTPWRLYKKVW